LFCRYQVNVLKWLLSEIQILSFHFKSALSEKNKNLSQEFMKMKAKKDLVSIWYLFLDRFKVMTVVHITPQIMRAKNDG
jgi:C4-dicarboxylate transporter